MRRALGRLTVVAMSVALAAGGLSCRSSEPTPTTRPGGPPAGEVAAPVPLVIRLVATPAMISTPAATATRPAGARPVTIRLTLVVSNTTSRTYSGESPDAAVARFALTAGGEPIWSGPMSAAQVVTPVSIGPGQQVTYHAAVTIPDARVYRGKVLTARGQFAPAALTTSTSIPVN